MIKRIAALYVHPNGPYYGNEQIDPWGFPYLDAREYIGPYPVIVHPPCKRWGKYWSGGPSSKVKYKVGDDDGCFKHALWAVRSFGGILEHPEGSKAWEYFGLIKPKRYSSWIKSDAFGYSCYVEQCNYGHKARKPTWLYAVNTALLSVNNSQGTFTHVIDNYYYKKYGVQSCKRLSEFDRLATPSLFSNLLLSLAQSCYESEEL
jgi:hypothetical protein